MTDREEKVHKLVRDIEALCWADNYSVHKAYTIVREALESEAAHWEERVRELLATMEALVQAAKQIVDAETAHRKAEHIRRGVTHGALLIPERIGIETALGPMADAIKRAEQVGTSFHAVVTNRENAPERPGSEPEQCSKCNGTRWYTPPNQRGTIHSYRCDACCKHERGRWQLAEHYGEDNGKWCCIAGCGKTWPSNE